MSECNILPTTSANPVCPALISLKKGSADGKAQLAFPALTANREQSIDGSSMPAGCADCSLRQCLKGWKRRRAEFDSPCRRFPVREMHPSPCSRLPRASSPAARHPDPGKILSPLQSLGPQPPAPSPHPPVPSPRSRNSPALSARLLPTFPGETAPPRCSSSPRPLRKSAHSELLPNFLWKLARSKSGINKRNCRPQPLERARCGFESPVGSSPHVEL